MTGWNGGYPTDTTYGIAWQAAQTPLHAGLVCALAGVDWQPRAEMVVADIGCGRGFAAGVLAAANPGWTVIGLDHNPGHIAEARDLAARAALPNARFVEADLGTLSDAAIDAWPLLDVVMVHGVWTWVSDAVRAGIVRLLARRLKPGGIAYLGYNALPGAAPDFALQRLFRHFAGAAPGGSAERAAAAVEAIRHLAATAPHHLPRTAMLQRILDPASGLEPAFLAHEFLTDHWRPVFQADLCAALAPARLSFVGSANLFEHRPAMVFSPGQAAAMAGIAGDEVLKDLCLARPFRADVFQRGPRPIDRSAALDRLLLVAASVVRGEGPRLTTPTGIAGLPAEAWAPMAAALAQGVCRLGDLRRLGPAIDPADLLVLLEGSGAVLPAAAWAGPVAPARRFNQAAAAMLAAAGEAGGQFALAAPVAGGGLACSALDLALVGAILDAGRAEAPDLAVRLRPGLDAAGHARAAARIEGLLAERFPVWRGLGIL
ncbi:class I SAM-dependent methyltransferase [Humitalea sp. 24SJ18S-53]|uniref:class I SAM-dependent methyltransferase n=1 Tax=Humitalea sp. 24SJ18S-53 TaxID=3422307 RepID=UPI003D67921C